MVEVTEVLKAGHPWWDQSRENSHIDGICCFSPNLLLQSKLIKMILDFFCVVPICVFWFGF